MSTPVIYMYSRKNNHQHTVGYFEYDLLSMVVKNDLNADVCFSSGTSTSSMMSTAQIVQNISAQLKVETSKQLDNNTIRLPWIKRVLYAAERDVNCVQDINYMKSAMQFHKREIQTT